jgi:hypothetical protein
VHTANLTTQEFFPIDLGAGWVHGATEKNPLTNVTNLASIEVKLVTDEQVFYQSTKRLNDSTVGGRAGGRAGAAAGHNDRQQACAHWAAPPSPSHQPLPAQTPWTAHGVPACPLPPPPHQQPRPWPPPLQVALYYNAFQGFKDYLAAWQADGNGADQSISAALATYVTKRGIKASPLKDALYAYVNTDIEIE